MKKYILATLIGLGSTSAQAEIDLYEGTMKAFMNQMSSLKTQDGKSVSDLFAQDTLQHFSGSEGNRVRLSCDSDTSCTVRVKILYGRHGQENGLSQEASYGLLLVRENDTVKIISVTYAISE